MTPVFPDARPASARRDPDPDGVALVAAVTVGVLAGAALAATGWVLAATVALASALAATLLGRPGSGRGSRARPGGGWHGRARRAGSVGAGVLVLVTLAATGAAVAGMRAAAVQRGVLARLAGQGGTVVIDATVAEEPDTVRFGGSRVVLSVGRVERAGRAWRTRERATVVLPRGGDRPAVGDRLRLRAGVERSPRAGPMSSQPPVTLRRPRVESRAPPRSRLLRLSESIRSAARERALASLPPERAGLLAGMSLGDTSLLGADLDRAFKAAGLTHLVAVSGTNVAVVLAAGLGVAIAFGAGRPALAGLGILLVALFALLTRWEPSVLRASAMAALTLLGVASGRGPGGRRALCLAVMLLLLANPALVASLGFRLSATATAGVLWLGPLATRALPRRLPEPVRKAMGVTLGAQAGAMPVIAIAFGELSLAGLAANLVALPLASAPMLLGVVAAGAAPVAPPLASLACLLAEPFLIGLIAVARWTAGLPGASLTLAGPSRLAPTLVVAAFALLAARRAAALDRAAEHQLRLQRSRRHAQESLAASQTITDHQASTRPPEAPMTMPTRNEWPAEGGRNNVLHPSASPEIPTSAEDTGLYTAGLWTAQPAVTAVVTRPSLPLGRQQGSRVTRSTFLTRVMLKNYKSISACDVRPQALTFLVGPNGAGKSNFLDALRFVSDALNRTMDHALHDRGGIDEVRRRSGGHPTRFGIRLDFRLPSGSTGYYAFRVAARSPKGFEVQTEECMVDTHEALTPASRFKVASGRVESDLGTMPPAAPDRLYLPIASGLTEFRPVFDALSRMGFYNLNPDRIRELQPPDPGLLLARDGSNLASVLGTLESSDPSMKQRIEEYLSRLVPGVRRVSPRQLGPRETLEFRQDVAGAGSPWRFLAASMSDGTLRAVGILVALLQSANGAYPRVPLVGIEGPEVALHPAGAGVLLDALREASSRAQVIVTSHSPDLLDCKDIATDALLTVTADAGMTVIGAVDDLGRTALRDRLFTPGELLRLDQLAPEPEARAVAEGARQLNLFERPAP